jgi:hypothetical protein
MIQACILQLLTSCNSWFRPGFRCQEIEGDGRISAVSFDCKLTIPKDDKMPKENPVSYHAVLALAGRRIDAPETQSVRFPLKNVPIVRERLAVLLASEHAEALVCSAACGADLIALAEAERLGLRRRIVLPFPAKRFRETSVTDRPGDWGPLFDRLITEAESAGDLVVLPGTGGNDDAAYAAANQTIVREAEALAQATSDARPYRLVAVIVWEGSAREGTDASGGLLTLAKQAGFEERSVPTQ